MNTIQKILKNLNLAESIAYLSIYLTRGIYIIVCDPQKEINYYNYWRNKKLFLHVSGPKSHEILGLFKIITLNRS